MMEERYHATTQNRFHPDMSNVNKTLLWRQNLSVHLSYIWLKIVSKMRLSVSQKPWDHMLRTVCNCFQERWVGNVIVLFTKIKTHFTISFGAAYGKV